MKNKNVMIIGGDLTNNGGIASVIKSYYKAYKYLDPNFELYLLKTYYYKDKSIFFEFLLLITSFFKFIFYLLFKNVALLHIHSSAGVSFYRKSIFVFIGFIFRRKIIIHLHSSRFDDFFMSDNRFVKFYQNIIFSLCDVVVVLCTDWEKKLKVRFPKLHIIKVINPTAVVDNHFVTIKNTNTVFKILFVGFLIESKGIKDLLAVADRIKQAKITGIKIVIAGKGDLEGYLKKYLIENELTDYVEFIGWISGESKIKTYENSDLFILPSYNEGMPISILEAMSFGLPVISTRIAGIPDVILDGRNGYLSEPGNIDEFFDRIIFLNDNRDKLSEISKCNLEDIKKYSDINVFKEIIKLYDKLICSHK